MEAPGSPLHSQQSVFFTRDQVYRNVPEVDIIFKEIKYSPTTGVREFYIKCNSNWIVFIGQLKHFTKAGCYHNLQICFVCFVNHDLGKTKIIFYYQNHLVMTEYVV